MVSVFNEESYENSRPTLERDSIWYSVNFSWLYTNYSYENITLGQDSTQYSVYFSLLYTDLDKVIIPIIMSIVVTIGIIGNILTIIVIASKKSMHSPVNMYFANLAIADIMFLITSPVLIWNSYLKSLLNDYYDIGEVPNWVCPLTMFLSTVGLTVALLTIFWLSIERYMAVCRPLKFHASGFGICSRSLKICVIIWLLGLSWNVPFLFIVGTKTIKNCLPPFVDNLPNSLAHCITHQANVYTMLVRIDRALAVLILMVVVSLYTAMLISLRRKPRITSPNSTERGKSARKVFLTVFATVTVYVVCMTPLHIYAEILEEHNNSVLNILLLKTYINSSINPVIYNVMNSKFRRAFCEVYCSRCSRKRPHLHKCRNLKL